MEFSAVVFDLDGTLVESHIDYQRMGEEIRAALADVGLPDPPGDRREAYMLVRGGAKALLERGLPPHLVPEALSRVEEAMNHVELEALPSLTPMPYAEEALRRLRSLGFKLGVATRSHGAYAAQALSLLGLERFIDGVVARDQTSHPKPHPRHLLETINLIGASPAGTLYVGDTTTDLETSRAAGVCFVGYWRSEEWARRLVEAGCRVFARDLLEVVDFAQGGVPPG